MFLFQVISCFAQIFLIKIEQSVLKDKECNWNFEAYLYCLHTHTNTKHCIVSKHIYTYFLG